MGFWFCTAKRCSSDSRSVGRFGPTTGPKGLSFVLPASPAPLWGGGEAGRDGETNLFPVVAPKTSQPTGYPNGSPPGCSTQATHGQFLDAQAVLPASEDEKRLGITVDVEKLKVENPLLRSWLFFAGANDGGSDENDGTLTALEAAQLDLWGTKLVVLSACETGVGEAKTGDGVYGLRRALVLAGSEAQLMSLWSVSDRATRELMVEYYTRLKAGEGRSDALRRVQLKMLKDPKRRHPFYWASFIQSGEWANLAGTRR